MPHKTKITFYGGAGEVTGSNFLIETGEQNILVDCGFFQGCDTCEVRTRDSFEYDPSTIPYLFVTHPHLDHVGRIPKLVKDGFRGVIYSTPPTRDLAILTLKDSVHILREEAKQNKKPALFSEEDIEKMIPLWKIVPYHETISLEGGVSVLFKDAGHVLGSSMVEFSRGDKKLVFTGDLGNSPAPLLKDTESIEGTNFLVMESVYGDRNHESRNERREMLEDVIEEVAAKKGTLLIPAFSIERTQELLFEIERMMETRQVPPMPVFVDSPLAIQVTEIYKKYEEYFNKEVKYIINSGNDLFSFKQLHLMRSTEESKKIFEAQNPKIIIAGSGMSMGGRIIYHEKHYLGDPNTMFLIIGYQAPGSLGRRILEGNREVTISGEKISVRARVLEIRGYSSHKDLDNLIHFVEKGIDTLQNIFVVMGEMKSATFLTQRLRDYLGVNAVAPRAGESVDIDF
ncbi:MAG: MBL fold metallo-hydrolase [Parcubacteria group bacterium]|nr:MBL fold metallo-hydrolase [Parcubacteria group bacterium]